MAVAPRGPRGGGHFNKHLPIGPSPSSIFTTLSTVPVSSILTTPQPLPPHTWPRFFRPWCNKVAYLLWPVLRHSTVLFSPDEQCTKMRVVGFTGCCFTTSDPHNITRFKTQTSNGPGGLLLDIYDPSHSLFVQDSRALLCFRMHR